MTCIMDAKLLKRVATADKDLQTDSEGGAMLLQPLTQIQNNRKRDTPHNISRVLE